MALQTEIWVQDIQDQVFPENSFIRKSTDHSAFINNLTVHVPNSGAFASVTKNRSSFPGTITQRNDIDLTYALSQFSTDPILISDIDQFQISYNKRQSLLRQFTEGLHDVISNQTAYAWAPSGATNGVTRIIKCSGALDSSALASGATGSRSAITLSNILQLKAIFDADNVPGESRYLLMPWGMYSQLLSIQDVYQMQSYGREVLPSGAINKIHGFNIVCRPSVVQYATASTTAGLSVRSVDGAGNPSSTAISDNMAAIAWHPNFVANAIGDTSIFYNENDPAYYGSIFSAIVYQGAAKLRNDLSRGTLGVAAIVQQGTLG